MSVEGVTLIIIMKLFPEIQKLKSWAFFCKNTKYLCLNLLSFFFFLYCLPIE